MKRHFRRNLFKSWNQKSTRQKKWRRL